MQAAICLPGSFANLEREWTRAGQQKRRREAQTTGGIFAERHRRERVRELMAFWGDAEADEDGPCPPAGWAALWRAIYSNRYGQYTPGELRQWGYVFWDMGRLEGSGAMELLELQWSGPWGEVDVRRLP
jgi:hypothetical protein